MHRCHTYIHEWIDGMKQTMVADILRLTKIWIVVSLVY